MAMLESTTPRAADAQQATSASTACKTEFESRLLTVGDCIPFERPFNPRPHSPQPLPSPAPFLRLKGRWLDRAGFTIGSKVRVEVSQGRLVIEALPQFPERPPRLPRRAEKLFF
jgi:hypothetical protein